MMGGLTRRAFCEMTGLLGVLLGGCVGEWGTFQHYEGSDVRWLNFKPEIDSLLQDLASIYMEQNGIRVAIATVHSGSYEEQLAFEMEGRNPPTLFVLTSSVDVERWGQTCIDFRGTRILEEQVEDKYNLYDGEGRLVGLAYCEECFGIAVNNSLLEQAGHTVFEITDFASLKAVVEDIHSRANTLGFDAFVGCDLDDLNGWRITGHLANVAYYYESRDDGGWEVCPPTIKGTYLDNFRNLFDLAVNNSMVEPKRLRSGRHDPLGAFADGWAAFLFTGSWDYRELSKTQSNLTLIPYYAGVTGEEMAGLCCGTENHWAINAACSDRDRQATFGFLQWLLTNEDAADILVDSLGSTLFVHESVTANSFLLAPVVYDSLGCYRMDWVMELQPDVDEYRSELADALIDYCEHQTDEAWGQVRHAFVDGWATHYQIERKTWPVSQDEGPASG